MLHVFVANGPAKMHPFVKWPQVNSYLATIQTKRINKAYGLFPEKSDKDIDEGLFATQEADSMDGILGLCSGRFTTQAEGAAKNENSSTSFDAPEGMSQLLGTNKK